MPSTKQITVLLALILCACAALPAQGPRFLIPEKIERATAPDEQGVQQWAEWPAPQCPSCKGKGKSQCVTCARFTKDATNCPECKRVEGLLATCRVCVGAGTIPDPLDSAPCAGCMGAGFLLCTVCGGGGRLKVGQAKRWSDCPACRGEGGFPCGGCEGERKMSALELKPSLRDAPLDKLQKAQEDVDEAIAQFGKFEPVGGTKARKAVKELGSAYSVLKKLHPGFKALPKSTKDYMGKIFAGKQFQGSAENEAQTLAMLKQNAEYYLKHQKRMLELAIKRAELNAQAGK